MRRDRRRYWSMVTMLTLVPLAGMIAKCKTPGSNGGITNASGSAAKSGAALNFGPNDFPQGPLLPAAGGGTINTTAADLAGAALISEGPFQGGPTGTKPDSSASIVMDPSFSSVALPTGAPVSPDFGAQAWTTNLLLFEEFGPEPLTATQNGVPFPQIQTSADPAATELSSTPARSAPAGTEVEALLGEQGMNPPAARVSDSKDPNPWWSTICDYLKTPDCATKSGPAEGRPPGEGWAHQRWDEFAPVKGFKTAQMGARENHGFRDSKQMHKYRVGEFGPGGLYHNTVKYNIGAGDVTIPGTTSGIKVQFHPKMPVQHHHNVWTFDGTMPPKLLMARYGEPVVMRHYNFLPIDVTANAGFGLHTITTHEHNGHNPAESDGFAGAYFFPGQFYDYRWPLTVAGHDTVNTGATDPLMSTPCGAGEVMPVTRTLGKAPVPVPCDVSKDPKKKSGVVKLRGDAHEIMSTHWFHDHMIDFTSKNVYKGNAAMMNYYSAIDRGNESVNDGINLRLPSGSALPWGNRDYDINLAIGDKAWDKNGQLWFNPFDTNGFLGDRMLVNFTYKPVLDVRARRYRFRILDAAVARYMKFGFVREVAGTGGSLKGPAGSTVSYEPVVFHMIGNDGNIMEHSVAFDGTKGTDKAVLPMQSIAERYDIIIDFGKNGLKAGDKVYMINVLEHTQGRGPKDPIPLASILNGSYKAVEKSGKWTGGDPAVGMIMRLDVKPCVNPQGKPIPCVDPSLDPSRFVEGNRNGPGGTPLKLLPRRVNTPQEIANMTHRTFSFDRSGGAPTDSNPNGSAVDIVNNSNIPWAVKTDKGSDHPADVRRVSAAPSLSHQGRGTHGELEEWTIANSSGGWNHPVHVHFEEGQIVSRGGKAPPIWEKYARKDMYRVGPGSDSASPVVMQIRFREFAGTYVEHCHNTTHEDNAMLVRWDIEHPGQTALMPSPVPTWFGVDFVDSVGEATCRTGINAPESLSTVVSGDMLTAGQSIDVVGNGKDCSFKAVMEDDGAFSLFQSTNRIWQSSTSGNPGASLSVSANGEVKIVGKDNATLWTSGTSGKGGVKLKLGGDGRLALQDASGKDVWSWNTATTGCGK